MEARLHCICAYFLSEIEVMHMDVPEVTDHAHAASHGSQKGMHANNIIAIIAIIVIIVLSLVQLIAIRCNNEH